MNKTETLDLDIPKMDVENKKTIWIIGVIIVVTIIIILIISFYIGKGTTPEKNGIPIQKSVNLLGEQVGKNTSSTVSLSPLKPEGYENSWQTATAENYRQAAKLANVKAYNTDSASAIPSDVRGMSFIREGFTLPQQGGSSGVCIPGEVLPQVQ